MTARLEAILRRRHPRVGPVVHLGGLVIDPPRRKVTVDGREVRLARKEFDPVPLPRLVSHPGLLEGGAAPRRLGHRPEGGEQPHAGQPRESLEIFEELQPDLVIEDNVVTFPALLTSGIPWVRIASCNPAEMKDHLIPPPFSGMPVADPSNWDEFWAAYQWTLGEVHEDFNGWLRGRGAPPLPRDDFIHESPWLNLYLYPGAIDYQRARPLGPHWRNLEACVRATDPDWELPEPLVFSEGPLIYLSMGSLGSADVELMRKLIGELGEMPYRVIVSKGPQHSEFELAENMVGEEFVPQTKILPQVDLVITHGGNNTVTESLYFGKPMVVLPIFWDQHDNAQRISETGFGVRLDTYKHAAEEMRQAIDGLLGDRMLLARLEVLSEELQARRGTVLAADLIEQVLADG